MIAPLEKAGLHADVINLLMEHMGGLPAMAEYAQRVDLPGVWSRFAMVQLDDWRAPKPRLGVVYLEHMPSALDEFPILRSISRMNSP